MTEIEDMPIERQVAQYMLNATPQCNPALFECDGVKIALDGAVGQQVIPRPVKRQRSLDA
jgi:hypothetical protein